MSRSESCNFSNSTVAGSDDEYVACTFTDCAIQMDGCRWIGCEFVNCVIQFAGLGTWEISGCHFNGSCRYELTGNALVTLSQLHGIFHGLPDGRKFVESMFGQVRLVRK